MITILCSGSRGDIQPYIALAVELVQMGRDVRIAAGKSFKDFIERYGIKCYPISVDYKSVDVDPELMKLAQNSDNPLKMLLAFNKMKKYAVLMMEEMFEACKDSELIVYHPGCTIGYFAAEHFKVPSVLASPFPIHKTKEVASVITYGNKIIPKGVGYSLLQGMLWNASKLGITALWKEKFGKLPQGIGAPFERVDEKHPSIISCSDYVFRRPADWNKNVYQYGYWFTNEEENYSPSKELSDFLGEGDAPIYFGFGSVFNPEEKVKFITTITDALAQTKKRGIICGMGQIDNLPQNIFAIDTIPHTWLFPKMAAVCHHGGAGTTAAGFAAGVPSMIMPFSNDQFAWANRASDLGVGSKPLSKKKLNTKTLEDAIHFVSQDDIRANARKLGEDIAKESGAYACARIIANVKGL